MKTLSVLLTLGLLFAADRLAACLKRAQHPPVNTAQPAPASPENSIVTVASA